MCLSWDSSHVFLMLRLRSLVWGRKATEVKCHFDHIIKRVHTVNGSTGQSPPMLVSLGHLVDVVFHGFLTVKLPLPHPRRYCPLEGNLLEGSLEGILDLLDTSRCF